MAKAKAKASKAIYCYNCGGYRHSAQYWESKGKGGKGSGMKGKGKGEFTAGNGVGKGGKRRQRQGERQRLPGTLLQLWKIRPFSQGMPNWWSKCSVAA